MTRAGKLYVVGTPIGNLADMSPRAAETLASVDIVAAEDTRVTRRLLERRSSTIKLISYREENEKALTPSLVADLAAGKSVALVADAGTPCISDPGYRLVSAAARAGIEVVAIPGPSAVIALLSVSGLPTDRFSFEGFPPARAGARRELLESLRGERRTVVFYQSPRRVVRFLEEISDALGDPPVAVGRELTKVHEEVLRGRASEIAAALTAKGTRGEFAIAVHTTGPQAKIFEGETLRREIARLLAEGLSVRDTAERLKPYGVARRAVYEAARRVERHGR